MHLCQIILAEYFRRHNMEAVENKFLFYFLVIMTGGLICAGFCAGPGYLIAQLYFKMPLLDALRFNSLTLNIVMSILWTMNYLSDVTYILGNVLIIAIHVDFVARTMKTVPT